MRLVTWNCQSGSAQQRVEQLRQLKPDVVVLQECRQPGAGVSWRRYSKYKGLAVQLVGDGWHGEAIPIPADTPLGVLPFRVRGPVPLTVVGVWTLREPTYVRHFLKAMEAIRPQLPEGPLVVMGDFNSTPKLNADHAELLRVLDEECGLVSAYHHFSGVRHGEEHHPTLYHLRKRERPFHIDFCFTPKGWTSRLVDVTVGSYDDWKDSDHRPLMVELDLS